MILILGLFIINCNTVFAKNHKILFVSAGHSSKAKVTLMKKLAKSSPLEFDHKADKKLGDLQQAEITFNKYDLVVFDAVSIKTTRENFGKYSPLIKKGTSRFLPMKWPEGTDLRKGIDAAQAQTLLDYYGNGGKENLTRMLNFINHRVFSNDKVAVAEPIVYPQAGIYHPKYESLVFDSLEKYRLWRSVKTDNSPVIGLLITRGAIEAAQTHIIDETMKMLEKKGAKVMAVFHKPGAKPDDYLKLLQDNGKTVVNTIINFRNIHYANKRKEEFGILGVPIIQALTYFDGDQKQWEESKQGISPGMMSFTLVLPETAGVIDPIIIGAVDHTTGRTEIIDYQLQFLVDRVLRYAALTQIPNSEKKLTVMFWGDKDMGASFLNVPESLQKIGKRLNKEGYTVKPHQKDFYIDRANRILDPFHREYELQDLLEDDLAELLPVSEYRRWLNTLPSKVVKPVNEFWGEPEKNFMVVDREGEKFFVIPRIRNGNMLVMRQPPRGDDKDQDQMLYHDTSVPMNHYYLAAYYYARKQWESDAFIHLGTHGSQEYLPGKERGLSRFDGGNLSVGTLPVMYPYIVDDVGEAMQAKRRGNAVTVSHMTPPYAAAGLQGVMSDVHELIHQYKEMDTGAVKEKTGVQIVDLCIKENLCKDFGWTKKQIDADFSGFLKELHDYMEDVAIENQPLGLHTFGALPEPELVISTIVQMLGREFIREVKIFEEKNYINKAKKKRKFVKTSEHLSETDTELEDRVGFKTVRDFVTKNSDIKKLSDDLQKFIVLGRQYYRNMLGIKEMDNLIAGLAGRYVSTKTGGDPIRSPDSLPTGFNLYGFDPARLPTKAAYSEGKKLVEGVIANHYKENGRYPEKLAFNLWSIEAMRHYGVLESQALYAMGVTPVWSKDGRVIDTKIIPASELKRPRVDVILSVTGLYRDAFPSVMQRIAKAIKQVSELKEKNNSLWSHSQRIKNEMLAEGVTEEEASYLSTVRIFSNASNDYGSGVDGPVFNSDTWETDAKIANSYTARMGFSFGTDKSRWGQRVEGLYSKQLSGTEVVMLSRSSNLYGMITSDDPFEYFGSISLAVRNIDGKSPKMMIANLRDAKNSEMVEASTFLSKELRSRNFNERWVQEMQKEGYSGAVTMSSNLANFWGWQVVDPNIVRSDQWQEFYEVYVNDKLELGLNEWFEAVNPASQAQMLERMLEATRKEYWKPDDITLQAMLERYQELVERHDLLVDNEKLRDFVNETASGFGLNMELPAPAVANAEGGMSQPVQGQELQKVEAPPTEQDFDKTILWTMISCGFFVLAGVVRQANVDAPNLG